MDYVHANADVHAQPCSFVLCCPGPLASLHGIRGIRTQQQGVPCQISVAAHMRARAAAAQGQVMHWLKHRGGGTDLLVVDAHDPDMMQQLEAGILGGLSAILQARLACAGEQAHAKVAHAQMHGSP